MSEEEEKDRFVVVELISPWQSTGLLSMGDYVLFEWLYQHKSKFRVCVQHCEAPATEACKCAQWMPFDELWENVLADQDPERVGYWIDYVALHPETQDGAWTKTLLKCWERHKHLRRR